MDPDNQDFVPTVFPCTKPSQSPKKRTKRTCGRKKRHRGRVRAGKENMTTAGPPVDLQEEALMEIENELSGEITTQSPSSVPKEEEALTKGVVTETKTETIKLQETPSLNITSPFLKPPKVILQLNKMRPVVLLKPIVVPEGVYECVSELREDKQLHEGQKSSDLSQADSSEPRLLEPSFSCNMCDRSFATVHNLKRHKLLHVKDGRKCLQCGVLFCRRHNRVLFQRRRPKPKNESEDEPFSAEEQDLNSSLSPDEMEPRQITETDGDTPPSPALTGQPPAPDPKRLPSVFKRDGLVSVKPSPVPRPPSPIFNFLRNSVASFHLESPVPSYPPVFVQSHLPKHPELPPSLRLFSPQYLTSALLDVQRNYESILNKRKTVKMEPVVKGEPEEPVSICPAQQTVKEAKKEKIAYDLEVIL
ncbi:uncharacterized protein LOC108231947 [Kryptolebias marmoratus]|uniref:uncharacterized protein LOC108231947 n=1 Tax=Kryptolebias marmoratus TaxID=37003 RepID=UPI0007F901FB|nr:uncharacterized protein LOC108231947 [Kryptolebias marmoratus]